MPRDLKPYVVDQITSPDGLVHADVMFDRNAKRFFVEVTPGDKSSRVEADLLEDVKRDGREALGRSSRLEWTQLMLVEVDRPWHTSADRQCAGIKFEFERFERAPHPSISTRFLKRDHVLDVPEEYRKERPDWRPSMFEGPSKVGCHIEPDGTGCVLLEYDEAVWSALHRIKETIEGAYDRLAKLLQQKDVARLLVAAPSVLQLTPPPRKSSVEKKNSGKKIRRRSER